MTKSSWVEVLKSFPFCSLPLFSSIGLVRIVMTRHKSGILLPGAATAGSKPVWELSGCNA